MISKKLQTREHILEKAYTLFAKRGFNCITMKDICVVTDLSRGGLYSHFSSTKEVFEGILEKINQKDAMNFVEEIKSEIPATLILKNALELMQDEMKHPEDSLSLAMYEYAGKSGMDLMNHFNEIGEKKWTKLIEYGISTGEFNKVNVMEIVNIILYTYQGVRMWSRIVKMPTETIESIILHIKKQLIKEKK